MTDDLSYYVASDTTCQRCAAQNPLWHVEDALWQTVADMGLTDPERHALWRVLCPTCFITLLLTSDNHYRAPNTDHFHPIAQAMPTITLTI